MRPIPIAQYLSQFGKVDPKQTELASRNSVLLRPRVLSMPADIEARVEEALERGRQEGLAAGRAECAESLSQRQAAWTELENERRIAWQANEYAQFAEKIERALGAIEERLAQGVARILKPFLIEERVKHITASVSESLSKILSREMPAMLKITGPEALLSVLREQLSSQSVSVEYVAADNLDVTIEANQTIIKSQLQAWIDHIETIGE
jgi:flagellar biosynthesis/type III secretory pathway protein FliH